MTVKKNLWFNCII